MKVQRLLFMMAMSAALFSCGNGNTNNNGDWVTRSTFRGPQRAQAVAFTVEDTGYVGLGFGSNNTYFNDFYGYSPAQGLWTAIAPFPGYARASASAFATVKYGYVGLGVNENALQTYPLGIGSGAGSGVGGITNNAYMEDFWRFDPSQNVWDSMPPVPITPFTGGHPGRYEAVGFSVPDQGIGAFLGGTDDAYQAYGDYYVWTEAGNSGSWSQAVSYPGQPVRGAVAFTHDDHVYLLTGMNNQNQYVYDCWYWDPKLGPTSAASWPQLIFPNGPRPRAIGNVTDQSYDAGYHIARVNAVAFSMNNNGIPKGYVMFGSNGANLSDCWEYDFPTDSWTPKTPYPPAGGARSFAIALTINDSGYVGLGTTGGSVSGTTFYQDFTQFYPALPYNQDDYGGN